MNSVFYSFLLIAISYTFTDLSLPYLNKIGLKFGIIDNPNSRKKHRKKISRSGGIAIYIGVLISFLMIFLGNLFQFIEIENTSLFFLFILGGTSYFFIGLIDDLFNISPFLRLLLQFLVAAFITDKGLLINSIEFSILNEQFASIYLPRIISIIFGSFWITGIVNSINWLDGLDGLASGFTSIVLTFLMMIILKSGNVEYLLIPASILGAILGFLKINYFPAKIFMGDSGSYLIGFALSFITLITFSKVNYSDQLYLDSFNLPLGILILLIPILDMCLVVFGRMSKGKSPFYPDRSHLHHRLVDSGVNLKKTVLIFYALTFLVSLLAIYLMNFS